MKRIAKGENALIKRNLKKADGTDLLLADTTLLKAEVIQNGSVLETITYPHARLRQGDTTSQVVLEINTTLSNMFTVGRVAVRWTIQIVSAVFSSELLQKDIITKDVLTVVDR